MKNSSKFELAISEARTCLKNLHSLFPLIAKQVYDKYYILHILNLNCRLKICKNIYIYSKTSLIRNSGDRNRDEISDYEL